MTSPLFIAGCGRSGTTFLHRILSGHPQIALSNEAGVADLLRLMTSMAAVPRLQPFEFPNGEVMKLYGFIGERYIGRASRVLKDHALQALEAFYRDLFADKDYRYWGDKLPEPETVVALQQPYPNLRAIILTRDPRDVLCSMRSFGAREDVQRRNRFMGEATPESVAEYWSNVYLSLERYVTHHLVVRYEDLVADPIPKALEILEWLSLARGDQEQARIQSELGFNEHGTSASPTQSVGRWQQDLTSADAARIEELAGDAMRHFGYG